MFFLILVFPFFVQSINYSHNVDTTSEEVRSSNSNSITNARFNNIPETQKHYNSAEKQRLLLIQRTRLAEYDLEIQKRIYKRYGIVIVVFILGLISYLFFNQHKFKHQQSYKAQELKNALSKIEIQNKRQEQLINISKDLHDNIGAQLAFIISSIDNLKYAFDIKDEKLNTKLNTISTFTSRTIYELRDSIWAMEKSEITLEDLEIRITNYIEKKHVFNANIQFNFRVNDSVDNEKRFTSVEGINIYRVVQEAIHNSLKHANASEITVSISKQVSNLVFKIQDNGNGFDMSTVKFGNGINSMKKHIQAIGGVLEIDSRTNQGTEIVFNI